VYAVVNAFIGVHSGGDFVFHLRLAERLLQGQPLYSTSMARWRPWPAVCDLRPDPVRPAGTTQPAAHQDPVGGRQRSAVRLVSGSGYRHAGRWTPVVLAVAAVAQPLQSNFQHLNINLVLLAFVVLAIADLEQGREMRAALWIGVATALKAILVPFFSTFSCGAAGVP